MNLFKALLILHIIFYIQHSTQAQPSDHKATSETNTLFKYVDSARKVSTLFGQQYGLFIRRKNKKDIYGKSEVFQVCGKYAAVHGWDFGDVFPVYFQGRFHTNSYSRRKTISQIKKSAQRGGIHTFSFHMNNPLTEKYSWDTTKAFYTLLPGGSKHQWYTNKLDTIAAFFLQLKTKNGKPIPIIFRPFHEHNGRWFGGESLMHQKMSLSNFGDSP